MSATSCPLQARTLLLGLVLLLVGPVAGQPPSPPLPRIDLARHFFASPQAEIEDRARLLATVAQLKGLKGRVTSAAGNLLRALRLEDAIQVQLRRHTDYLYLRHALNTLDEPATRAQAQLESEVLGRTAFLRGELLTLGDSAWRQMISQEPALKPYSHAIESIRRDRPHTLPTGQEEVVHRLLPAATGWQFQLYEQLRDRTAFGSIRAEGRDLDVWKQRAALADSPDRAVREAAFRKRYAGFASQRDLYAFTLLQLASARNQAARLRHYDDAASEAYFRSEWRRADVQEVLARVRKHAGLYQRYQRLRAENVRRITGDAAVNVWDLSVHRPGFSPPRFTFDQAAQAIREPLAPLGPDFGHELALLLEPANGRLDIAPGEHRSGGGFSLGFVGTPSVFFGSVFTGRYNDLRVMAHEGTHAVHRQLMSEHHVLPPYASGPSYLFESFAVFSELLLADRLGRRDANPDRQEYFLEQFLDGKGTVMFVAGPEAELEEAVYDADGQSRLRGADDLDTVTQQVFSRYSIWFSRHRELRGQWMMIPLLYEDPFYNVNYVYGALLALTYLDQYAQDPERFVPRYVALMKNGFDAPAAELLKRFLGIDTQSPAFVDGAMRSLEKRITQLEECYARKR